MPHNMAVLRNDFLLCTVLCHAVYDVPCNVLCYIVHKLSTETYGYTPGSVKSGSVKSLLEKHDNFDTLYKMSIDDPETFWGILALEFLQWMEPFQKVMDCDIMEGKVQVNDRYSSSM